MSIQVVEIAKLFPFLREDQKDYAQIVYLDNDEVILEGAGVHAIGYRGGSTYAFRRYISFSKWYEFLRKKNIELKCSSMKVRKAKRWERKFFYKIIPEYLAALKVKSGAVDHQVVEFYPIEELLTHKEEKIRRGAQRFIQGG